MLMDYLYEAVDVVTDARIAGVIGADGIGVEMLLDVESVPHDIRAAELELASLVASCNRTADRLSVGQVYDVVFHTDELTYLLSLIIPGYFAVLGVLPDGNMDRARFALWQIVNRCQTDL